MKRHVFTFGTLYEDGIIQALLGSVPDNFYASLPGHAMYKGAFSELPEKMQAVFSARGYDDTNFSYLFVKSDPNAELIEGKAYAIDLRQELILDHWEWYPDWYRKQAVAIQSSDEKEYEAFVYTLDYQGERLSDFKRVVNDPMKVM